MSGMNMGLSSEMERRAEDGTDFSHFGDESNKGNELGLDSEPQGTGGPKPRKHKLTCARTNPRKNGRARAPTASAQGGRR